MSLWNLILFCLVVSLVYYLFFYQRSFGDSSSPSSSRYQYPFVTPPPRDVYWPTVMIPWNVSTWGPDTNRRTFEIGEAV